MSYLNTNLKYMNEGNINYEYGKFIMHMKT